MEGRVSLFTQIYRTGRNQRLFVSSSLLQVTVSRVSHSTSVTSFYILYDNFRITTLLDLIILPFPFSTPFLLSACTAVEKIWRMKEDKETRYLIIGGVLKGPRVRHERSWVWESPWILSLISWLVVHHQHLTIMHLLGSYDRVRLIYCIYQVHI